MDSVQSVALAAGLAWGSGLRLYAVLFAAGLLSRLGYLDLPQALHVLQHPWVLGAAGTMLLIEFLADKIPIVDSFWDAAHSFIRIPAGAVLAAAALGEHDPVIAVVAAILGGTLAAGTHAAKAGARALINTSPEPLSNLTASFGEEAALTVGLYTAFAHPMLFLALLLAFLVLLAWLLPRLWRGVRMLEPGEIEQALNAASAIGDDRLQQQSRGVVIPESFKRGFESGEPKVCDTFKAARL